MTSHPGYRRYGGGAGDRLAALWGAIRRRRSSWTVDDVRGDVSARYARRIVAALAGAGWVARVEDAERVEAGRYAAARYVTRRRDRDPPRLVGVGGAGGVEARQSDMDGAELQAARHALGLTVRGLAEAVGYRDARTVRRMMVGDQPVPPAIAERVRALLAENA